MSKPCHPLWMLVAVLCGSCGSGEVVTNDDEFAEGYPGGSQNPPATQEGVVPNFPDCPECSNACLACIEAADSDDDIAFLQCVNGAACQAYLAESGDSVPEYGVSDDNILLVPEPGQDGCEQLEDPCLVCECAFGVGADECDFC